MRGRGLRAFDRGSGLGLHVGWRLLDGTARRSTVDDGPIAGPVVAGQRGRGTRGWERATTALDEGCHGQPRRPPGTSVPRWCSPPPASSGARRAAPLERPFGGGPPGRCPDPRRRSSPGPPGRSPCVPVGRRLDGTVRRCGRVWVLGAASDSRRSNAVRRRGIGATGAWDSYREAGAWGCCGQHAALGSMPQSEPPIEEGITSFAVVKFTQSARLHPHVNMIRVALWALAYAATTAAWSYTEPMLQDFDAEDAHFQNSWVHGNIFNNHDSFIFLQNPLRLWARCSQGSTSTAPRGCTGSGSTRAGLSACALRWARPTRRTSAAT